MATHFLRNRKILFAGIGVLVLGGATWGVVGIARSGKVDVPKEFSVKAIEAQAQNPGQVFEQIHEAMTRTDLTEEQKHAIRENAHTVMEAQMDKRMDAYFTASSASEQQAILDQQIDEMIPRMKEMEQRHAQWQRENANRGAGAPQSGAGGNAAQAGPAPGSPGGGPGGPGMGGRFRGPGGPGQHDGQSERQHQKMRTESRDPDRSARRMQYFTALRQRAEQRGIQMPGFMGRGPH